MAIWGTLWGGAFRWGGAAVGPVYACQLTEDRVLIQHPDAPGERQFRDWICKYNEHAGEYIDVCAEVKEAFDVDTAVGEQLDMIGSWVGLPRSGFTICCLSVVNSSARQSSTRSSSKTLLPTATCSPCLE